ncbi:50S ribosomal protein L13 [Mycolicibacterium agri]|uniref:Large ribosomal subunit protein uL13 n=1 Tax=Mycolicibacterium agri TaxID=36811 RepID=A0A7I9W2Q2_MYCAG|nr:50S ribosomal protein L13 [Mycolicibacterium agri]
MSVAETIPAADALTGTRVKPGSTRVEKVDAVPTYTPKAGDTTRTWYVIDATDVVLGRLAVAAATLLRGKHKPTFTPNVDGGDFVIVINADKVAIGGDKLNKKFAYRHSGYPGGLHKRSLGSEMQRHPDRVVEKAIVGMLPHNKLGRQIKKKLKVYAGPEHPHTAQQPVPYEIKQVSQ